MWRGSDLPAAAAPFLSSRGAPGLRDAGFALSITETFYRELNPQLTRLDMNYLEPHLFQYSDTQGSRSFREEIAKFLTGYARAAEALNPERITVMSGCCDAFCSCIMSTVLCVPGDGYLIPAPYYGSINSKTWLYGGIQPTHGPFFSEVRSM